MAALYNGVEGFGALRTLQRVGKSLDDGKRLREIDGNNRIRAWYLLKSCSVPSRC